MFSFQFKKFKWHNFWISCFIFLIITTWIFAGWPQIWKNPPIPPKIQEARAAVSFIGASTVIATNGGAPTAITPHASTQDGDLLVFYHYSRATGGDETVSLSSFNFVFNSVTANYGLVAVGWRIKQSGDTTFTATITNHTSGTTGETVLEWIETYRGFNTNNPIVNYTSSLSTWASSLNIGSIAAPATATVHNNDMVVVFGGRFENVTGQTVLSGDNLTWSTRTTGNTNLGSDAGAVTQNGLNSSGSNQTVTAKTITTTGTAQVGAGRMFIIEMPDLPTVTTQAASTVEATTATGNGNITATGGQNNDKRGFVYDTSSKSLPGNVAPTSSGYANYAEDTGTYGTGAFTKALSGLNSNTTYYTRAYSHNDAGYSYGGEVSFLTKPGTPTGLNFTSVTATTLRVNWTAPTGGATSYKVERCTGTGCSSYSEIAAGVTNTYYDDSGRTGNTVYRYQVRATNITGDGAYSSGAEQLMLPDVPTALNFTNVQATSLRVNWTAPTGGADSYKVERCQGASCTGFGQIASGVINTYYDDSGLTCNTLYRYRVRATNTTGDGTYSSIGEQTTGACGTLTVDIVDSGGTSVPSPSMAMGAVTFSFTYQTANGTFGVSTQKIRVNNTTANPQWTLTVAAQGGSTSFWDGATSDYDFNDPTANAGDGSDADSLGGQMTTNASGGTLTPQGGCNNTGLTLGSSASFSEGVTDSVTLITAGASASTNCYWDLTGVSVSQTIPSEQTVGNYSINMTLTVTAN